ncbi:MAG TPA: lipid-A-disaccharide synthase, partial [Deltaproteobacteria bacterium]|nr:lipid-A-disaccharide synthase [Deltaproteobacteria bacterium]
VSFVGHPMTDIVQVTASRAEAAASLGLDPRRKIVGLFPGSRRNEIERLLPVIVDAAVILQRDFPDIQFVLPLASTLGKQDILPRLEGRGLNVRISSERIHDLIRSCDAIISVSGTVTLEIALVGTPMVIIYRLAALTYQLAKRLVKVENIGLCNIVAGGTVVQELIQDDASPEKMAAEITRLLTDDTYNQGIRERLSAIRSRLGEGGASANVARLAINMIGPK